MLDSVVRNSVTLGLAAALIVSCGSCHSKAPDAPVAHSGAEVAPAALETGADDHGAEARASDKTLGEQEAGTPEGNADQSGPAVPSGVDAHQSGPAVPLGVDAHHSGPAVPLGEEKEQSAGSTGYGTHGTYRTYGGERQQSAGSSGKNPLSGCTLCHVDVEDEFVRSVHFREKVGCKDCHGPSEGHLADENNEVKPDELFARKDVDRLCGKCHACSRPPAAESAKGPKAEPKVCTDCHGPHDLALVKQP